MMNIFHHNNPRPPVVPGEETGVCQREVEGCSPEAAGTPPPYLRWATSLPILLADPLGVQLFFDYLHQEGQCHADALEFWFACKGLHKESDADKVQQIIKAIYRRFFVKTQLPVSEALRKALLNKMKRLDVPLSVSVFDQAQQEVEKLIHETSYPNFLRSDVYVAYVRSMQNPSLGASDGSGSSSGGGMPGAKATLATLVEDQELDTSVPTPCFPALTKDALMMTQSARASDYRPVTEPYVTDYLRGKPGVAKMYSSYNPVSRQDSELQSLSSDARTESDNMSLTDSSIDGMSLSHHKMTRKQYQLHCRKVKEAAFLNRDPYTHQTVIPRTQRIQRQQQVHPMKPDKFAAILTEKLEAVKKEQEYQEKLDHKLFDAPGMGKSLAEAIRERFQMEDDDVQHILDQHVSRVFSDLTPGGRSPGSPRPRSPEFHRSRSKPQMMPKVMVNGGSSGNASFNVAYPQTSYQYPNRLPHNKPHSRKEKDAFSTFSSDSGNVRDFSEGYERGHLPKSKSMPDYSESSDAYSSLPGHGRAREWPGSSRNKYRKPPELTDSGVSVVSDTLSIHSTHNKQRVMSWLLENDQNGGCFSDRDSPSPSSASCQFDYSSRTTRSNPQSRGRRSPPCELSSLEEARRRLEDQSLSKNKSRQRSNAAGRSDGIQSGGSTLRSKSDNHTTVVFSFCDEQFPYRSKIPGNSITLKQFKEYLPKKGNYRYFFKMECEELDMKVIQEEITDDNEVLPLWDGNVIAQVKPVD